MSEPTFLSETTLKELVDVPNAGENANYIEFSRRLFRYYSGHESRPIAIKEFKNVTEKIGNATDSFAEDEESYKNFGTYKLDAQVLNEYLNSDFSNIRKLTAVLYYVSKVEDFDEYVDSIKVPKEVVTADGIWVVDKLKEFFAERSKEIAESYDNLVKDYPKILEMNIQFTRDYVITMPAKDVRARLTNNYPVNENDPPDIIKRVGDRIIELKNLYSKWFNPTLKFVWSYFKYGKNGKITTYDSFTGTLRVVVEDLDEAAKTINLKRSLNA